MPLRQDEAFINLCAQIKFICSCGIETIASRGRVSESCPEERSTELAMLGYEWDRGWTGSPFVAKLVPVACCLRQATPNSYCHQIYLSSNWHMSSMMSAKRARTTPGRDRHSLD